MTDTGPLSKDFRARLAAGALLSRDASSSLVEQIVHLVQVKIDDKLLRSGARMPSIRQFSGQASGEHWSSQDWKF